MEVSMAQVAACALGLIHTTQSALELGPSHCPNGRLGQDLGFGGFAFALKLPELLNTNLPTVRAKLGQTPSFHNGPQIWCPTGQCICEPNCADEHNQALPQLGLPNGPHSLS